MKAVHHHALGRGLTSSSVRGRLVSELRGLGISDERVLEVMGRVPRHEFVDPAMTAEAYRNRSLPIGHAQTISQPYMVALMTEVALGGGSPGRVLEVGTGSGYQTAVLSELADTVFTVERLRPLTETARARLLRLGYRNVHCGYADGSTGWAPYAPYDAIVVTAAATTLPPALIPQLAMGGRLVVPVGQPGAQSLKLYHKTDSGVAEYDIAAVTFVPLLTGRA